MSARTASTKRLDSHCRRRRRAHCPSLSPSSSSSSSSLSSSFQVSSPIVAQFLVISVAVDGVFGGLGLFQVDNPNTLWVTSGVVIPGSAAMIRVTWLGKIRSGSVLMWSSRYGCQVLRTIHLSSWTSRAIRGLDYELRGLIATAVAFSCKCSLM